MKPSSRWLAAIAALALLTVTVTTPPGATVGSDVSMRSITGGTCAQARVAPANRQKNATASLAETAAPQTLQSRKK